MFFNLSSPSLPGCAHLACIHTEEDETFKLNQTFIFTFLRWPSLSLKISSCSWYSACDNLQRHKTDISATSLRAKIVLKRRIYCSRASYVSLSVPLALLLRLFCSRLGGGVWAIEGGLRLASSFLCRSMSSRWELILSCCL